MKVQYPALVRDRAPRRPPLDAYVSHSATLGGESNPEFPIE